jgi:hypothetical protein
MLVDRGLLDYDRTIASYWPKFARHGKGNVTIRDLMQHRAGLAWFCDCNDDTDDTLHLFRIQTDEYLDEIAARIGSFFSCLIWSLIFCFLQRTVISRSSLRVLERCSQQGITE